MANWADVKRYMEGKYKIHEDQGPMVHLLFSFNDGRSQIVTVSRAELKNGEEWVTIDSPIGKFAELDLERAVRISSSLVCGAISSAEDWVTLRDSFPIAQLDADEFDAPLNLVVGTADELERELTGKDSF